jgi:hypothetical protein
MRLVRMLALTALATAMLAGTAGLTSLRGESACQATWPLEESGPTYEERFSLWPPGVRCLLVDRTGAILDEAEPPYSLGLVLLMLEVALWALIVRARPAVSLALRAAAAATAALLSWGLVSLYIGFPASWTGTLIMVGPIAACMIDRLLCRLRHTVHHWADGVLGLLIAPAVLMLDLFAWILLGVLGHAATVAAIAAVAATADRSPQRVARPAWLA